VFSNEHRPEPLFQFAATGPDTPERNTVGQEGTISQIRVRGVGESVLSEGLGVEAGEIIFRKILFCALQSRSRYVN